MGLGKGKILSGGYVWRSKRQKEGKKERVIGRMIMSKKGFGDTKKGERREGGYKWWEELSMARAA